MKVKDIILNNYNIIGKERKLQIDWLTIGSYEEVDALFKYVSRHGIEYNVDNIRVIITKSSSNDNWCKRNNIECTDSLNFKNCRNFKTCGKFCNDLLDYYHMKDQDYKNPLIKSALKLR